MRCSYKQVTIFISMFLFIKILKTVQYLPCVFGISEPRFVFRALTHDKIFRINPKRFPPLERIKYSGCVRNSTQQICFWQKPLKPVEKKKKIIITWRDWVIHVDYDNSPSKSLSIWSHHLGPGWAQFEWKTFQSLFWGWQFWIHCC